MLNDDDGEQKDVYGTNNIDMESMEVGDREGEEDKEFKLFDEVKIEKEEDKENIINIENNISEFDFPNKTKKRGRKKKGKYKIGIDADLNILLWKIIYKKYNVSDFLITKEEYEELQRAYEELNLTQKTDNPYLYILVFNVKSAVPIILNNLDKIKNFFVNNKLIKKIFKIGGDKNGELDRGSDRA